MKAYGKMWYNFNEFFILFSLISLSVSSSFFSQTPIIALSSSYIFFSHHQFSSTPTSTINSMPASTSTHHFHVDLSLVVGFNGLILVGYGGGWWPATMGSGGGGQLLWAVVVGAVQGQCSILPFEVFF